jgi:hypothetical protein
MLRILVLDRVRCHGGNRCKSAWQSCGRDGQRRGSAQQHSRPAPHRSIASEMRSNLARAAPTPPAVRLSPLERLLRHRRPCGRAAISPQQEIGGRHKVSSGSSSDLEAQPSAMTGARTGDGRMPRELESALLNSDLPNRNVPQSGRDLQSIRSTRSTDADALPAMMLGDHSSATAVTLARGATGIGATDETSSAARALTSPMSPMSPTSRACRASAPHIAGTRRGTGTSRFREELARSSAFTSARRPPAFSTARLGRFTERGGVRRGDTAIRSGL